MYIEMYWFVNIVKEEQVNIKLAVAPGETRHRDVEKAIQSSVAGWIVFA